VINHLDWRYLSWIEEWDKNKKSYWASCRIWQRREGKIKINYWWLFRP